MEKFYDEIGYVELTRVSRVLRLLNDVSPPISIEYYMSPAAFIKPKLKRTPNTLLLGSHKYLRRLVLIIFW